MPPPKKPRCRDAPWFFLAREGLSARPEWARNRRWTMPCNVSVRGAFQLTPSARRATSLRETTTALMQRFQSTPSARRATKTGLIVFVADLISIHALREESDLDATLAITCRMYFNPRPPRGGRRKVFFFFCSFIKFQSTPSARRATVQDVINLVQLLKFQSTLSVGRAWIEI